MITEKQTMKAVVDLRQNMQRNRVRFNNQLKAFERGADDIAEEPIEVGETDEDAMEILGPVYKEFKALEAKMDRWMFKQVAHVPIVQEMMKVRGVGEVLAAKLYIGFDINRARSVSSFWKIAGLGVVNGERERPTKGQKLEYSKDLKTLCMGHVADCFIKSNSPYRKIYDEAKAKYVETKPDWTLLHCANAAKRKMVKVFLCHLYMKWCELEGKDPGQAYVFGPGNHDPNHFITPEEMGWI